MPLLGQNLKGQGHKAMQFEAKVKGQDDKATKCSSRTQNADAEYAT